MDEIKNKVDLFMQKEMPQIRMHGGDWEVLSYDEGTVVVSLFDACSGCGISPMTIQAIKKRMPDTIDEIEEVKAHTTEETLDPTDGPF